MKRIFRGDSISWEPGFATPEDAARFMLDHNNGTKPVTPEDAARVMLDAPDGAAAARRRMLERQQGRSKSESVAAARLRMLQR